MRHALVIGDDATGASRVESRLRSSGYASVAHAGSEADAWRSIALRRPGLIVVVAQAGRTPPVETLSRISRATDAPVLVAAAGREQALACIGTGASLDGPFPLDRMEDAVRAAAAPALAAG